MLPSMRCGTASKRSAVLGKAWTTCRDESAGSLLPLPQGEGWGEGTLRKTQMRFRMRSCLRCTAEPHLNGPQCSERHGGLAATSRLARSSLSLRERAGVRARCEKRRCSFGCVRAFDVRRNRTCTVRSAPKGRADLPRRVATQPVRCAHVLRAPVANSASCSQRSPHWSWTASCGRAAVPWHRFRPWSAAACAGSRPSAVRPGPSSTLPCGCRTC